MRNAATTPAVELYLDGALVANGNGTLTDRTSWDTNLRIGTDGNGAGSVRAYNGSADEVRVETAARSAAWIGAQYASQNDGGFLSFGSEQ